ncbi:unnamed protein product, partial [Mycena citricolor]
AISNLGSAMIEGLPVELIGKIVGDLSLDDALKISQLSRRLRAVSSDPVLNVWRPCILRNLKASTYETAFKTLSVHTVVPRHNWLEILSLGRAAYLLFDAVLPNLPDAEWEEAFKRRFLTSWASAYHKKAHTTWKSAFLRVLQYTWHRSTTTCSVNEAWTKYILLNRNGTANYLEGSSRGFSPFAIFEETRTQQNLLHLPMRVRVLVEFSDARVLVLGTLNRPRSSLSVNANAKLLLQPPGIRPGGSTLSNLDYSRIRYPLPAESFFNYPFYTSGGSDRRWLAPGDADMEWVGSVMLVAQIITRDSNDDATVSVDDDEFEDLDFILGPGRNQYASFTWEDLWTVAPWIRESISKEIDGAGLGL